MSKLHSYTIALILALTLFFNIERLDYGGESLLNMHTSVYVVGIIGCILILFVPVFRRIQVAVTVLIWIGVYFVLRVTVLTSDPLLTDGYMYLTITETAFLTLIFSLSAYLARVLHEFEVGMYQVTLLGDKGQLPTIIESEEGIEAEMTRGRYYERPISVVVVRPDAESMQDMATPMMQEMQQRMVNSYTLTRLAQTIRKEFRLMDMIMEDDGQLLIVCPEVAPESIPIIMDRVTTAVNQFGIQADYGTASFPEEALTFEGLVEQAKQSPYMDKTAVSDNTTI